MATLVANNPETPVSRIELRPGINTVGRAEGNHHVISHGSVSSRHCEIVAGDGTITVRDLGSTNGTFVDDKPIQQSNVAHGQRLKLGSTEFVVEAPDVMAVPKTGALRVGVAKPSSVAEAAPPPVATGRTAAEAIAALTPAVYDEPGFYRQLPNAFAYPFNKQGMFLLALGAVFFLIIALAAKFALFFRLSIIGLLLQIIIFIFTYGYLFAYMQRIVSSSAQGEDEVPEFPDVTEFWSDIIVPFLLFAGTFLVSFAPAIAVSVSMRESGVFWYAFAATLVVCALYFPMALLAVAVTDNFLALSPHVVFPSIARVFVPYLVACLVLGLIVITRLGTGWLANLIPIPVLPSVLVGFISLYLLVVEMRILGLLFRSYRERLGWL
jgi:hypothetical protein